MINVLSPILLNILYDSANAKHNLIGLIASRSAYVARFKTTFSWRNYPGAYNLDIRKSTTVVNRSRSKA